MDDLLALVVILVIAFVTYQSMRQRSDASESAALRALVEQGLRDQDAELANAAHPVDVSRNPVTYHPLMAAPEGARPLVSGLLDAMRSVGSLEGFSSAVTPSVLDELRSAIAAVTEYASDASPETSGGLLETRLYDVAVKSPSAFDSRVFIGTPYTQASKRTVSLIRQDLILRFGLVAPVECELCGAPLGVGESCEFCGARSGDPRWRVVGVQPASAGASEAVAESGSFVGYRMPDRSVPVQAIG